MRLGLKWALVACVACLPAQAFAQEPAGATAPPAASQLPPVEVIQKKAEPAPKTAQKKAAPKKKQAVAPAPQPPPEPVAPETAGTGGIDSGTVMMSPVAGSEVPIGKYPAAVGRASQDDIAKFHEASVPEVLQNTVPGVVLSDAQGNAYQRTLQYRGFDSSPLNGDAQGLAVYQNGVRINESFGDIVNWDFLPDNAIAGISILGANPVYGLNAIGGAIGITMRDGFNFQGVEIDSRFGSFGHKEGRLAVGARSGNWGAFAAGQIINDDGFRDFSDAEIRRFYGDLGVKGDGAEFHLNLTHAENSVGVTAAAPEQLLDLGWEQDVHLAADDRQRHDDAVAQRLGQSDVDPDVLRRRLLPLVQAEARRRQHRRHHGVRDSDRAARMALCWEDSENDEGQSPTRTATPSSLDRSEWPYAPMSWARSTAPARTRRAGADRCRRSRRRRSFGLPNQFLVGASYDHGNVQYSANSELGYFGPNFVVHSFDDPIYHDRARRRHAAAALDHQRLRGRLRLQYDRRDEGPLASPWAAAGTTPASPSRTRTSSPIRTIPTSRTR